MRTKNLPLEGCTVPKEKRGQICRCCFSERISIGTQRAICYCRTEVSQPGAQRPSPWGSGVYCRLAIAVIPPRSAPRPKLNPTILIWASCSFGYLGCCCTFGCRQDQQMRDSYPYPRVTVYKISLLEDVIAWRDQTHDSSKVRHRGLSCLFIKNSNPKHVKFHPLILWGGIGRQAGASISRVTKTSDWHLN